MKQNLRIGTRGSRLALIQTDMVKTAVAGILPHCHIEVKVITTKGDRIQDSPPFKTGDKGFFTGEIENELLYGNIDCAVHSLKDLPTILHPGLVIGGVLERGIVNDVLLSNGNYTLHTLPSGASIGTSSLRRKAQLSLFRSDFRFIDIRGNIDTRIRKMKEGYCDAIVLAGAGVIRSGFKDEILEYIDTSVVLPAVSQGIIGIETREDDVSLAAIMKKMTCQKTMRTAMAERMFLKELGGGCYVPVGCMTASDTHNFIIKGILLSPDGSRVIKEEISGPLEKAVDLGKRCARLILSKGGDEILKQIRLHL